MRFTGASVAAGASVDVRAVAVVEVELAHHLGEQGGVHPLDPAGAVLVVLHGHDRRLDLALEARHDEGLRVGLLEVVDGAVRDVLAQLPALALARPGATTGRCPVTGSSSSGASAASTSSPPDVSRRSAARNGRSSCARRRSRSGSHSSASSTPGSGPVVQLVRQVQRELQVVAVRVDVGRRDGQAGPPGGHRPAPRARPR